jgi:hypothetical protein
MPLGVLDDEDLYWNGIAVFDEDDYEYDDDDACRCEFCV